MGVEGWMLLYLIQIWTETDEAELLNVTFDSELNPSQKFDVCDWLPSWVNGKWGLTMSSDKQYRSVLYISFPQFEDD